MDIEKYFVQEEMTVLQVMQCIDKNARGIAYVLKEDKLVAAVTDGDIRRYIINHGDLQSTIRTIANYSPFYILNTNMIDPQEYMIEKSITSVPIIDKNGIVLDVKFYISQADYMPDKPELNKEVVIMAGGKGTRLKPYTDILPKPLIPIGDKTITEHIMDRFAEYGCRSFKLIVNYKRNFIKSYFTDSEIKRNIDFFDEEEFLGTGGGLRLLKGNIQDTFFMSNCDILVDTDYEKLLNYHKKNGSIITMVCAKKEIVVPYGIVNLDDEGNAKEFNEKPSITCNTNTGLYVIEPEFLQMIPENTFIHITDLIQKCIDQGQKVGVYLIEDKDWMDMGQLEELEKMKSNLGFS